MPVKALPELQGVLEAVLPEGTGSAWQHAGHRIRSASTRPRGLGALVRRAERITMLFVFVRGRTTFVAIHCITI